MPAGGRSPQRLCAGWRPPPPPAAQAGGRRVAYLQLEIPIRSLVRRRWGLGAKVRRTRSGIPPGTARTASTSRRLQPARPSLCVHV